MEGSPYEIPLAAGEYFSEHRRQGLLKLGIYAMFETQMGLADSGVQTRDQALSRIRKLHAEIAAAQEERNATA